MSKLSQTLSAYTRVYMVLVPSVVVGVGFLVVLVFLSVHVFVSLLFRTVSQKLLPLQSPN